MKAAAIDIGTNSVLLSIAQLDVDGEIRTELDRCTITRLGQGVDGTRRLDPSAVERTLTCLVEYAGLLEAAKVDRLDVVGTSALRDAQASEEFLDRAATVLGRRPRVIAGAEEAELTFRGALSGLGLSGSVVVLDVGGGSTEVISGETAPGASTAARRASLDVGCVRMTERHISSDPPHEDALAAIRESTRSELQRLGFRADSGSLVAVAGTATTLAAVDLELRNYDGARVHGHVFARERLEALLRRISALPNVARAALPGMEPRRADVIVAGGVILTTLLEEFGHDRFIVSDRGVRYGLLASLLAS
jgi:exopolyphosphatase/guanosine-5'-triphosphate,3'-diphosphate pyrophosphatase